MSRRSLLDRGVATGLRLSRGTADRAVRTAGPVLGRVVDTVATRFRRPAPSPPTTTTFVPTKKEPVTAPVDSPVDSPVGAPVEPSVPTPAVVAHNIAPKRPSAKPARKAPTPRSAPGAKLPPPRPSAT